MSETKPVVLELPQFAAPRNSRSSDEWYTPRWITRSLGKFDLDPASSDKVAIQVASEFYTIKEDGLQKPWHGRVWLNPPFSDIRPWAKRMIHHNNGIMLCFARTEAAWFHELVRHCGRVFLVRRRVQFNRPGETNPRACPMGIVLFPFGESNAEQITSSGIEGIMLWGMQA
jgi:phage N-6-adenine-methyltransferase